MNMYKSILVCLVAASSVMASVSHRTWDNNSGAGDGLWTTASNWNTPPDAENDDIANIKAAANGACTLTGPEEFIGDLYLWDGILNVPAGALLRTADAGRYDHIGKTAGATATMNIAGQWKNMDSASTTLGIRMVRIDNANAVVNVTGNGYLRVNTIDVSFSALGTGKVSISDDAEVLLTKSTSPLALDANGTMQIEDNGLLQLVGDQRTLMNSYISSGYLYTMDPGGLDVSYNGSTRTFVTVIPEPATLGLVAMAGFGALFVRRFARI